MSVLSSLAAEKGEDWSEAGHCVTEAYDRFDTDSSGALGANELGKFLQAVMAGVKPAQQRYFRTMLDINDDGKVTYLEMVDSLKARMPLPSFAFFQLTFNFTRASLSHEVG